MRSVSLMLCPVPKPLGAPLHLISGSATMVDQAVLKRDANDGYQLIKFSNHGRSSGSQTQDNRQALLVLFSNHGRSSGSQTHNYLGLANYSSVTMADQVALKLNRTASRLPARSATMVDQAVLKPVGVDMPFDLGISISKNCKICQVFLFLRPARSFFRSGSRISASVYSHPDGGMGTL